MEKWKRFLKSIKKFPIRLSPTEAELLKPKFQLDKKFLDKQDDKSDIEYRYFSEVDEYKYILIEEFMFKEGEVFLNIENAIGKNYFLSRVKK
ncbi:MAG: hypothetical protein ACQERZ_00055 [Fusobacteriota bacterium]